MSVDPSLDLDRLEDIVRYLRNERNEIDASIQRGHLVAEEIRNATRQLREASGEIGMAVSRLRR